MNYLNVSAPATLFQEVLNSDIFVDKSCLIDKVSKNIRTSGKYICITRPRRFGKTVNASMLGAYYTKGTDNSRLFDGLDVAGTTNYRKHLNTHNVIFIDFSHAPDNCGTYEDYIRGIRASLQEDLREAYPVLGQRQFGSTSQMLRATGDSFIFILDEWDFVFYRPFVTDRDKNDYLGFLRGLLKDQPYVELAYMTGILPIRKYSSGSELNMFDEFNFMNDNIYDVCFGFDEDEVRQLCATNGKVSFEELRQWYDGYFLSDGRHLFNPRSVSRALSRNVCLNYWTETGPMNEIADCIEHNIDEVREDIVRMVAGIPVEAELQGYSAAELQLDTRDEILSAMVVYGFLSCYDGFLKIPNHELMEKFQKVLSRDSMGEVKEVVERSKEMLQATLDCDETKVASILEYVHDREIPFLKYGDENSLSCVITLCYLYARRDYRIEREEKSGKGYCDYLFYPRKNAKPAIILELKVKSSCEQALQQIRDKNYIQKVKNCREILLVGISYDEEKHHKCRIERVVLQG